MLVASRAEARKRFNENRNLDPRSQECTKALDEAEGVSMILRQNIVQGAGAKEGDSFSESRLSYKVKHIWTDGDRIAYS